ncbi:MAG: hypothetical protein ACI9EH_000712, partial [Planktomarina sp.]
QHAKWVEFGVLTGGLWGGGMVCSRIFVFP